MHANRKAPTYQCIRVYYAIEGEYWPRVRVVSLDHAMVQLFRLSWTYIHELDIVLSYEQLLVAIVAMHALCTSLMYVHLNQGGYSVCLNMAVLQVMSPTKPPTTSTFHYEVRAAACANSSHSATNASGKFRTLSRLQTRPASHLSSTKLLPYI